MNGRLWLDRIDTRYDPASDVLLGPWCLAGRDFDPTAALPDFVVPFPTAAEFAEARDAVTQLVRHEIERMADMLDRLHGTGYTVDFWHILLVTYVLEMVTRAWMRWVLIGRVVEANRQRTLAVAVKVGGARWPFVHTGDVMNAIQADPDFSWWFDSEMVRRLAPAHWHLDDVPVRDGAAAMRLRGDDPGGKIGWRQRLRYSLAWGDLVQRPWAALAVALYVNLLPRTRSTCRPHLPPAVDVGTLFPAPFLAVLRDLLDRCLPSAFRDDFKALDGEARSLVYRKGRLRVGAVSRWNETDKLVVAHAHLGGEKIVQHQHGGGLYGTVESSPASHEIEYRSDAFITWGWSAQADYHANFLPLPSPWLSRHAGRHRPLDTAILFMGPTVRFRLTRLAAGPRPDRIVAHLRQMLAFVGGLSDEARGNLVYRPYAHAHSDVDDGAMIRARFPQVPLVSGDLDSALLRCRLHVAESPSTTLCVAMAADVPTVAFWNPDDWPLARQAVPLFEDLRRVGILFHDAAEAARHVSDLWPDIQGWWTRPRVQEARRRWAWHYARARRHGWWIDWARALARM